jgi:hypothetical protein
MKKTMVTLSIATMLTGCASPMPNQLYDTFAGLYGDLSRCNDASYITSGYYTRSVGFIRQAINSWSFDVERFTSLANHKYNSMKSITPSEYTCKKAIQTVNQIIEQKARQDLDRAKLEEALSDFNYEMQNIARRGMELNREIANTKNVPTNYQLSTPLKVNALPAPSGYGKSAVPSATVGVLRNVTFDNGTKVCEYSNGTAIRVGQAVYCHPTL